MAVLLGLCDGLITEEDQSKLHTTTNKIGGDVLSFDTRLIEPACLGCQHKMSLIVQLSCPLDDSPYQRILHVFSCSRKICQNISRSWRVLRCQQLDSTYKGGKIEVPKQQKASDPVFQTSDWCDEADDWGDGDEHDAVANLGPIDAEDETATTVSKIDSDKDKSTESADETETSESVGDFECISETVTLPENTDIQNVLKFKHVASSVDESSGSSDAPFVAYYMSAVEEPATGDEVDDHVTGLLKEYEDREGSIAKSKSTSGGSGEGYEKAKALHGDDISRKFLKRVSRYPQQCLRYSWNGEPLLIAPPSETITICQTCGQKRTFEMQLMPALLTFLKKRDNGECFLEFGTVLIYSCPNSCWNGGDVFREEQCILQLDPDNELFS